MINFIFLCFEVTVAYLLCGVGLYVWLYRAVPCVGAPRLALCASLGLALLGWTAVWVFYFELSPSLAIWFALALSCASLILARQHNRWSFTQLLNLWHECRSDLDVVLGGFIALLVIFSAGYSGNLRQPFRVGIDQVGYAMTAQYLADGGTKSAMERSIMQETLQPTIAYALNAHVTALSFNINVVSEYLCMAQRFGYPMLTASLARVLHLDPVADYQFSLLAIPLFSAFLLLLWMGRDVIGLPGRVAKIIALAYMLNCNHLNVLFEGQHAQLVVAPFLVLFFGLLFIWRRDPPATSWGVSGAALASMIAVVSAGIFLFFSEVYLALGLMGVLLFCWDFWARDFRVLPRMVSFASSVVFGWMACGLYFVNWCSFILKQISSVGVGTGGFWQPHWAYPAEILGYASIYDKVAPFWERIPNLVPRDPTSYGWLVGASGMVFLVFFSSGFWRDRRELRFWVSPFLVCLGILFYTRFVLKGINYSYTKTFILLLIPLVLAHWGSLYRWTERLLGRSWAFAIIFLMISWPLYVGLGDSMQYAEDSRRLPDDVYGLRQLNAEADLSRYAICTEPVFGLDSALLGAYIPFNWLNIPMSDKKLTMHQDKEVAILLFREGNPDFDELSRKGRPIYRGLNMILLPTGRTIKSLQLTDIALMADKTTASMQWPHSQAALLKQFINEFVQNILHRPASGLAASVIR